MEDAEKAVLLCESLKVRAGIRYRRELSSAFEEVRGVRARLERPTGLRGREEERALGIDLRLERTDRLRVGRVEDVETADTERPSHHFGRKRRAAHAEHDDVVDGSRRDDVVGKREDPVQLLQHVLGLVEPAEPLRLVGAGPDSRVAVPDPLDEIRRDAHAAARTSRFAAIPCFSSSNESLNFCTPSRSSVSVTSL